MTEGEGREQLLAQEAERATCEVYPENENVVAAFLRLATQWRIVAVGSGAVYQGIDYGSIPFVLSTLGISDRKDCFWGLRVMEAAAVKLLNERSDG